MKRNADINLLNLFQPQKRVNSQSQIALQGIKTQQKQTPFTLFPEIDPFRKSVLYPLYNSYDSKEEREDDFEEWKAKVDEHFQNLVGQKRNMPPDLISSTRTLIELYPEQRESIEKYINEKEKKKQESWKKVKSIPISIPKEQPREQPHTPEVYHQLFVHPHELAMDKREQDEHALEVQRKWLKEERTRLLENIRKYREEFKDKDNPHLPPEWQMNSILNMVRDDIEFKVPKEVYDRMSEDERFAYDATMGNIDSKKVFPEEKETIFKRFLLAFMLITAEHSGMYPHLNRLVTPSELTSGVSKAKTTLLSSQIRDMLTGRERNVERIRRKLEKALYPSNPQVAKRLREFDESTKLPDEILQQYIVPTTLEDEDDEDRLMLAKIRDELTALEDRKKKDSKLFDDLLGPIHDEVIAMEEGDKTSRQNFDRIASQIETRANDKTVPKVVRAVCNSIARLYYLFYPQPKITMEDEELNLSTEEERKERGEILKEIFRQKNELRDSLNKNRQFLPSQPYLDLLSRIREYDEKHPQDKLEPFLNHQFIDVERQIEEDIVFASHLPSFMEKFNQARKLFDIYYNNAPDDPLKKQPWLDEMQRLFSIMKNYFYYIQKYSYPYYGKNTSARKDVVNSYQKIWDDVVNKWDREVRDSVVNQPSEN